MPALLTSRPTCGCRSRTRRRPARPPRGRRRRRPRTRRRPPPRAPQPLLAPREQHAAASRAREQPRDRRADAARGAGDDRDPRLLAHADATRRRDGLAGGVDDLRPQQVLAALQAAALPGERVEVATAVLAAADRGARPSKKRTARIFRTSLASTSRRSRLRDARAREREQPRDRRPRDAADRARRGRLVFGRMLSPAWSTFFVSWKSYGERGRGHACRPGSAARSSGCAKIAMPESGS